MDYNKFGIVIAILTVIIFNIFLFSQTHDENFSKSTISFECKDIICSCCEEEPLWIKIYDYVEVPISAIIGFVIAWFFYQRRVKEAKTKRKEIIDNILDNMDFLHIGVNEMTKHKEIPEHLFDSLNSTQDLLLNTIHNASHVLEQQEINNFAWVVKGEDAKTMHRFNPKLKTYGPSYQLWLGNIETMLKKYKMNDWDKGIKEKLAIIGDITNEIKQLEEKENED